MPKRIFLAIPQRTADSRRMDPAPTIAPVIVWVVLRGIPRSERNTIVTPPPVSAQNPPTGCSFVSRIPRVLNDPPSSKIGAKSHGGMLQAKDDP